MSSDQVRCYPAHVRRIAVVETNAQVSALAARRLQASPVAVEFHALRAGQLPFEDKAFDHSPGEMERMYSDILESGRAYGIAMPVYQGLKPYVEAYLSRAAGDGGG